MADKNLQRYVDQWVELTKDLVWQPHPANHPQVEAYITDAFETLYGGAAGGGKSDLILGLARTMHRRSLLLRRTFPDLERSLISRSLEFYGAKQHYNGSKHVWDIDNRRIEFGHMEHVGTPQVPGDESQYASAPYDLIAFDQLEQFPQYAYEFMFSRARSAEKGKRVQVIGTANPVGEGIEWIMRRWRAWLLDKTAVPGEILWYKRNDKGEDVQTTAGDPDGVSRTYIPAGLKDNPFLSDDYRRTLNILPEPLRSALLNGDWQASLTDDAYQVIPRAWIRAAMKRWTEEPPAASPIEVGADIARGGDDQTVFAPRRGDWYGELQKHPGRTTPDGNSVTDLLAILIGKKGHANIDIIGVGAAAFDVARNRRLNVSAINFSEKSDKTDKSQTLHFVNKRAELYWSFRDALDPTSERYLALPPDPELEADLCAPRWQPMSNGIKIEDKKDIKTRLGRSPDCGDAVVLAFGDYTGMSDDDLEKYGKNEIGESDITNDAIEYYADTYGIPFEKAKEMLLKEREK